MPVTDRDILDAIAARDLAAADHLCQLVLREQPGHAWTWECLGHVAALAGLWPQAVGFLATAQRLDPSPSRAAGLIEAQRQATAPISAGDRYLVIQAWGYGFGSELNHLLGGLLLAEITGRQPVVHWGANCLFASGGDDALRRGFEPLGPDLEAVAGRPAADYAPAKWTAAALARGECRKWTAPAGYLDLLRATAPVAVADQFLPVANLAAWIPPGHRLHGRPLEAVYRDLFARLRPNQALAAAVDAFCRRAFGGGPFLAVHLRGSDKVGEVAALPEINRRILEAVAAAPALPLFAMTDDARELDRLRQRFGARLAYTECRRTQDATGVHLSGHADAVGLGIEAATDLLIAARAERFIGAGVSNPAALLAMIRPPGTSLLIGPNLCQQLLAPVVG